MYAKWISEDKKIGPKFKEVTVIKKGEIKKIHAQKDDLYILKMDDSTFGWVKAEDIEVLETRDG